ncbi:MAG: VWA domain-containing protein [Pirellulaceae bacterium]|nr:VWA domain-containing protein [Pirellulaceae bacterium]
MPSLQEDLLPDHLRDDSDATANRLENDHLHEEESRRSLTDLIVGAGAVGISTFVHAGILIILGLFTLTPEILESFNLVVVEPIPEVLERPEELVTIELEENIDPATELTNSQQSSTIAGIPNAEGVGQFSEPTFDTNVIKDSAEETGVEMADLTVPASLQESLMTNIPLGSYGDPREIVDNLEQAIDRITQEIVFMLEEGDVLVVWLFDQSESMRNDQKEIRERINKVYSELGLADTADGDHLLTAITSYGANYFKHTKKPTSDLELIRRAINEVPIDPSGYEIMCPAITRAINDHESYRARGKRQMALIVVTDESGEPENNLPTLEMAVATAKEMNCRTYFLGREAVFGYPHAYMNWRHPQTGVNHWLQVDRGPETAFVEQLQTNGFRRRRDAFSSGFGPYEQCRIARESGGIFFMLPTIEKELVGGEADKRRYELNAMKPYLPDLDSRQKQLAMRKDYPLRSFIWQVIVDLNPLNEETAQIIELDLTFPREPDRFLVRARQEQEKAKIYINYLANTQALLEEAYPFREDELNARWQANYDLIYAQLIAYQARVYEYGAALETFIRNPKQVPQMMPPNRRLIRWDLRNRLKLSAEEVSRPYINRASELFEKVIELHPGTPWAERASEEIKRGFGLEVMPVYRAPPRPTPNAPRIPIPKL